MSMHSVSLAPRDRLEPPSSGTAAATAAAAASSAARSTTLPLKPQPAAAAAAASAPAADKASAMFFRLFLSYNYPPSATKRSTEKVVAVEAADPAASAKAAKKRSAVRAALDDKTTDEARSPVGKKLSADRLSNEEAAGPPVMCTHLKPAAAGTKSRYDFSLVCRKARVAQLSALTVQFYVIHSEWDRIGNFHFVLLFVALATHAINTFMRWRDSIDGRFDLAQIFLCHSHNLRVQYALAVLSGPLLALFTYWFLIPQKISLVHATFYSIAAFIKLVFAVGCFILEVIECSRDSLKPHFDYLRSQLDYARSFLPW